MKCRDFTQFILEYQAGELSAETRLAFEQHLRKCRNCDHYLHGYELTVLLEKAAFESHAGDHPVPADVPEELVQAILAAQRRETTRS
jgi:anti-sigma factor RsiW